MIGNGRTDEQTDKSRTLSLDWRRQKNRPRSFRAIVDWQRTNIWTICTPLVAAHRTARRRAAPASSFIDIRR